MKSLLENDVAVVTGAASGNGRAISLALAEHGADVVVSDVRRRPRGGGRPTHETINQETDSEATYVECDVTSSEDIERAVRAADQFGGLTIMVNNAGVTEQIDFLSIDRDGYDRIMETNVWGTFAGAQLAAERMIAQSTEGSIITMSSIIGFTGRGDGVTYSTSKGAVRLMTYAMADALGSHGIRVNAVHPGLIRTAMSTDDVEVIGTDAEERYKQQSALGRVGQPEDVAGAVVYLASPLADFVTGESIIVDGGLVNIQGGGWDS